MHRSGTSALTRILNPLGVSLGPEEQLLEPAPHNPAGFWENERVFELNDELLEALGGNATTPPVLADGWERASELDGLRTRAASLVASLADGAEIAGWKDPRLSLTLPFWRTVAPVAAGDGRRRRAVCRLRAPSLPRRQRWRCRRCSTGCWRTAVSRQRGRSSSSCTAAGSRGRSCGGCVPRPTSSSGDSRNEGRARGARRGGTRVERPARSASRPPPGATGWTAAQTAAPCAYALGRGTTKLAPCDRHHTAQ